MDTDFPVGADVPGPLEPDFPVDTNFPMETGLQIEPENVSNDTYPRIENCREISMF